MEANNRNEIKKLMSEVDQQIIALKAKKERLEKEFNKKHENEKVDRFMHTYSGNKLLEKHKLDEVGDWDVYGEDPNCDLGGHHSNPFLGRVHGSLEKVIIWAVDQRDFWAWGGGGEIKPASPDIKILKL